MSGETFVVSISGRAPDIADEDLNWLFKNLTNFWYNPSQS
jgi:hypothetical protein